MGRIVCNYEFVFAGLDSLLTSYSLPLAGYVARALARIGSESEATATRVRKRKEEGVTLSSSGGVGSSFDRWKRRDDYLMSFL